MHRLITLYTSLAPSKFQGEGANHPLAFWPTVLFVLLHEIFAIVALTSDLALSTDRRMQIFQQSGIYP